MYAVIDAVSVYGTAQNVTANITKHGIDGDGVRQTNLDPRTKS